MKQFRLVSVIKKLTPAQRLQAIPELLRTGDLTEQDISEIEADDVRINFPAYEIQAATNPEQRQLWHLFQSHPHYLARALVRTFPNLYYSYGFAMRMVLGLKAKLGNILVTTTPPGPMPEAPTYVESLPLHIKRDLLELYRECKFRECLYFFAREQKMGFDYIDEQLAESRSEFDRVTLEAIGNYASMLFDMEFSDFVPSIGASLFPSFHVRWWIDRIKNVPRSLCIGGTGTQKTAFGIVATHHYDCKKVLVICTANARTQWDREMRTYFRNPSGKAYVIGDRRSIDAQAITESQYVIAAYTSLIRDETLKQLLQIPFDGIILDECQYGKNAGSAKPAQQAEACETLVKELKPRRLIALSATPWENDPRELGAVASAIMPEVVPNAIAFRRWNVRDPRFLREFMASHVVEVEIDEIHDLPSIDPDPHTDLFGAELIAMHPHHAALYRYILDDSTLGLKAIQKVHHLLQATAHPHLLRNAYAWPEEWSARLSQWELSTKLAWLKARIERELALNAKVAVGSGIYAEGITRTSGEDQEESMWIGGLLKKWFGNDHVLILDANVSLATDKNGYNDRDRLIARWRSDPSIRVLLISMRTCPDSIRLTIDRQPRIERLFVTAISFGWKPWSQFLGRFYRIGQQVPIAYAVPILAGTIDESLLELLKKKHLSNLLFRAQVELTDEEWSHYANRNANAERLLRSCRTPFEHVNDIVARMKGKGETENARMLESAWGVSTAGEVFARSYLLTQEYTASGHISRCMEPIIREFELGMSIIPEEILDAGCGPLTLERRLSEPVYGIDMNRAMIELGRAESIHRGTNATVGYLSDLPDEWNGKFRFVISSITLHWSSHAKKSSERITILSELVRVTHRAGLIWIAIAESMLDESLLHDWIDALSELDYVIIEALTGLVRSRDVNERRRRFQFWSICFAPDGKPFVPKSPNAFRFLFEERRIAYRNKGRVDEISMPHIPQHIEHRSFEIIGLDGECCMVRDAAKHVIADIEHAPTTADSTADTPRIEPNDWRTYVRLLRRRKKDTKAS